MAGKTFHVEIVTPLQMVYEGEVESVTLPGVVAPFQVLVNHAPIVTELEIGGITVNDGAREDHYATSGGFVEMRDNRLTVILESVEHASAIDVQAAERLRQEAEERVREARAAHNEPERQRAEQELAIAANRIKVATAAR